MSAATIDLSELLSAGEWADIQLVPNAGGLMANRAVFATAVWLRQGGRPAFIKLIVPAGDSAGPETRFVAGRGRLRALHARLSAVKAAPAIPVVPLFDLRLLDPMGALLVAMARVDPLQAVIQEGRATPELGLRLLRDLAPAPNAATGWLHFDICPRNVGVLPDGHCVFIDIESLYLEEAGRFPVSVPAWKPFRAPPALAAEINAALPDLPEEVARRKMALEIALIAAECALGPLPPGTRRDGDDYLDEAVVTRWFEQVQAPSRVAEFWRDEFRTALVTGRMRPLSELGDQLEHLIRAGHAAPVVALPATGPSAPVAPVPDIPQAQAKRPEPPPLREVPKSPEQEDGATRAWRTEWELLTPMAHALRAGRLSRSEIGEYARGLERLVREYPARRAVWEELLLVTISYEKDAVGALEVARGALGQFPDDRHFAKMCAIVERWTLEQRR